MTKNPTSSGVHRVGTVDVQRINPGSELPAALRALVERSAPRRLAAGEILAQPGARLDCLWWLQSGRLRCYSLGPDGSEFNHDFVGPGEWACGALQFGPDQCCLDSGPGLAALVSSEVRVVDLGELQQLRSSDAAASEYLFRLLLQASARRLQREADLVHLSAEQRYAQLIDELPWIEAELSQKQIALWLGITPVALSRIRRRRAERSCQPGTPQ